MKLITRETDYAVRALCYMAKGEGEVVSVSALVGELKIPRPFLRKLLQVLHKKGILNSFKGNGGGFSLALRPDKIFITGLINIFQGPFCLNECIFKKKLCPNRGVCILREKISDIERYVTAQLKAITISSLVK